MPQKSFEDELTELGYDDLIPAFRAAVQQGAQAMLGAQQQHKSKEDWFAELFRQNPDLKGHEETVHFIIGRDTDLHDMPVSKSYEAVAERARKRLEAQRSHEEYMKPYRAYSDGGVAEPAHGQKHLSVDDFEREGITRPGSLGDPYCRDGETPEQFQREVTRTMSRAAKAASEMPQEELQAILSEVA